MKFEHFLNKVEKSKEYCNFSKKNPQAYLCAGFFVLDLETGNHMHQLDYSLPNKKIATFVVDKGVKYKLSKQPIKKKLPKIKNQKIKTDLEALQGIVEDEMKNRTVTGRIKKIIAVLHIMDDRLIWNLQCILDGMGIIQLHIDDSDQSILKFETHSLMDLIRTIPGGMPGMQQQGQQSQMQGQMQQQGQGQMPQVPVGKKVSIKQLEELIEKAAKQAKGKAKEDSKKENKKSKKK